MVLKWEKQNKNILIISKIVNSFEEIDVNCHSICKNWADTTFWVYELRFRHLRWLSYLTDIVQEPSVEEQIYLWVQGKGLEFYMTTVQFFSTLFLKQGVNNTCLLCVHVFLGLFK